MRVLVTGASGFLGGHITAALVAAGHGVRAFVRSPDKLARALAPLDTAVDEVATGDVTDGAAVRAALDGCDAVIHTANVYTLDPRRTAEMTRTNVTGTEVVLAEAEAGCDPVVHVSTAQTFWPWPSSIDGDPPLAPLEGMPYSDSKKRAEAIARSWQDRGAPVVTTYPGETLGPHDPRAWGAVADPARCAPADRAHAHRRRLPDL